MKCHAGASFTASEMHTVSRQRSRTIRALVVAIAFALAFGLTPNRVGASAVYSVRDFGAVGDGATLDTRAIQTAIDTAAAAGGGEVVLPAGTYPS